MGRRADHPKDQAAKGFPGKRRTKVERAIAEAERLADLLASAPAQGDDPLSPPRYITDKRLKPALAVWQDYAPQLAGIHLLTPLDRHTFAILCVYMGEFVAANEEILRKGYSVNVKTVSGDKMPRENPAVSRRDLAVKVVLELSKRFGLTPLDRYGLFKDQPQMPASALFGRAGAQVPREAGEPAGGDGEVIGLLDTLDSPPPRPN